MSRSGRRFSVQLKSEKSVDEICLLRLSRSAIGLSPRYNHSITTVSSNIDHIGRYIKCKTKRLGKHFSSPSSSSDWINRSEWRSDTQRRWSMATQKIKNLLAVSDALSSTAREKQRQRNMSIEQKSIFLDKFSTRERRSSGASLVNRKPADLTVDWSSNISSTELKELYADLRESKTNISNNVHMKFHISPENKYLNFLKILFEPYSSFIYFWSWILMSAIHYNSWIIILRVAFPEAQIRYQYLWFSFDYMADFIYLVDLLVSSKMSFLENGLYVNDVKRVMLCYLKSKQFLLDMLSLLPLDIMYIWFPFNPILRSPKLIKYYKVFTAKRVLESMTNFPNLFRGVFWLHIMFLLMHWNACFFFIISKYEGFGSNDWVYPQLEGIHHHLVHRYIKCMYWSTVVLTTIGESSIPETTIE